MRILRVEHLRGPLQGLVIDTDPSHSRLLIGRVPSAAIKFPADSLEVGVEHLELVRDAGRYELRLNTDDPVLVNGRAVTEGYELREGDEITLGHRFKGPQFRVSYIDTSSLLPATRRKRHTNNDDDRVRRRHAIQARWGATALAAVCFIGFLLWEVSNQRNEQLGSTLNTVVSKAEKLEREAMPSFDAVLANKSESVYQVLFRSGTGVNGAGTAWVVADGILATNAHVAKQYFVARDAGIELIVRSPTAPFRDHVVEGISLHPAYDAFNNFWQRYLPGSRRADGSLVRIHYIEMYDVALMYVSDSEELAPPLTIADTKELHNLRAGQPLAYIGYPVEGLIESDFGQPQPRTQVGNIVTLESVARQQVDADRGLLVVHSLPLAGGASGSPIFDRHGKVIALASAGNLFKTSIFGPRYPNAVSVNFAQRADFLLPLLHKDPIDLVALKKEWKMQFASYESEISLTRSEFPALLESWANAHGGGVPMVVNAWERDISKHDFSSDGATVAQAKLESGQYLITAMSLVGRNIDLSLIDPNSGRTLISDEQDDYTPVLEFRVNGESSAKVILSDPELQGGDAESSPIEYRLYRLANSDSDRRDGEKTLAEFAIHQAAKSIIASPLN